MLGPRDIEKATGLDYNTARSRMMTEMEWQDFGKVGAKQKKPKVTKDEFLRWWKARTHKPAAVSQ